MIRFVGVGPGDPELMTLAAVHALEWADEIAIADSGSESAVLKIAGAHLGGKPVLRLDMPMRGGHAEWQEAHRRAADILLARLSAGVFWATIKRAIKRRSMWLICTPFTGHPVEGVLLCGTHMSTKGNV